ncbi:hypothetical protein U1Q18_004160 [Sarracenia purpurea var. burkii]
MNSESKERGEREVLDQRVGESARDEQRGKREKGFREMEMEQGQCAGVASAVGAWSDGVPWTPMFGPLIRSLGGRARLISAIG